MSRLITPLLGALTLSACATSIDPNEPVAHVQPLSGSPVMEVTSDYSTALQCLADYARAQPYPAPRVAVGHISDLTGAEDYLSGRRLTQGATLMAITAMSEAGMRLVERFDMGVVQVELDYAQSGLLRDAPNVLRTVQYGQMEGADLYPWAVSPSSIRTSAPAAPMPLPIQVAKPVVPWPLAAATMSWTWVSTCA